MIRIISAKRLAELERIERRHDEAVHECNTGFGRWCAHNDIARACAERMLGVLKGTCAEHPGMFRLRIGLDQCAKSVKS